MITIAIKLWEKLIATSNMAYITKRLY